MRGDADVIVFVKGTPRIALVAQVKQRVEARALPEAKSQLKRYMLGSLCPIGLIVTPSKTHVLVDTFEAFSEESVREAGEFNTADFLGLDQVPTDGRGLMVELQRWLEQLTTGSPATLPHSADARSALLEHVVPAVVEGRVSVGPAE